MTRSELLLNINGCFTGKFRLDEDICPAIASDPSNGAWNYRSDEKIVALLANSD